MVGDRFKMKRIAFKGFRNLKDYLFSRKGQSQIVSAVLITGILTMAVAVAYLWGVPLLQKSRDRSMIESTVSNLKELNSMIEKSADRDVKNNLKFPLNDGTMKLNTSGNTITYQVYTKNAYVNTKNWTVINGESAIGVEEITNRSGAGRLGRDNYGVFIARAEKLGNEYLTTFKLVYRELIESGSDRGYRIDLTKGRRGKNETSGGTATIVVSNIGSESKRGASEESGVLRWKKVSVNMK